MTRKTKSFRTALIAATGMILIGSTLAACEDQEARNNRFGELVDDVIDQVTGEDTEIEDATQVPTRLANATPAERAISGRLSDEARAQIASERRRIAVGSIVAKPLAVERIEALVDAQEPQLVEGIIVPAPVEEDGSSQDRPDSPQGVQALPSPNLEAPAPRRIVRDTRRSQRRIAMTPQLREVQLDAQSTMFGEMDKLGLSGTVAANDSGMMVIDLFAEPTQLNAGENGQPLISDDIELHCPDTIDKETMHDNKVLATGCMIDLLRASGQFEYVEKDYIFSHQFARRPPGQPVAEPFGPDDTLWDLQWNFRNNGTQADQSPGGSGFVDFWSRTGNTGSPNVTVAVVDTGLLMSHPDIANSPNLAPGWDMVSDPQMGNDGDGRDNDPNDPGDLCNPNIPFAEDSFHGTHVAGTIGAAASNNGAGVAGGAWNVTIVPVRALGKCGGRLSDINEAIRWAGGTSPAKNSLGEEVWNENEADIINLSIGLNGPCPASLQDAIDSVVKRGAVVVAAAGNARQLTEFYAPGGCNNVISVAASDARGYLTPYSNFGPEVDLLAPGGDLLRDDNADGRPDGVLSTKPSNDCYDALTDETVSSCYYAYEQGTSMAAPHASAALALIAAQNPQMTGAELTATLMTALSPRQIEQCSAPCDKYPGATPIPDLEGMCVRTCGAGLLNLEKLPN